MSARGLWSPSRIKAALQCGRKLQGLEEGWTRTEHIRGIRGRAVHSAVEGWETKGRAAQIEHLVVGAWKEILDGSMPEGFDSEPILTMLAATWDVEAEIEVEKQKAEDNLAGEYKAPRRTKEFAKAIAHLDEALTECAGARAEIEQLINAVDWPWESERGVLAEGFDHSLETTRKGVAYLTELWPSPDIIASEWHLQSKLPNGYRVHGYIDRVEASGGVVEVVDYKSSRFHDTVLDHWLQAATYAVIAEDHLGFAPDRVRLAYMRDQDSDVFEVKADWRDRLASLVEAADRVLASESFAPTFAGCGICGFLPICQGEFQLTPIELEAS
jgi:hypothetical protein